MQKIIAQLRDIVEKLREEKERYPEYVGDIDYAIDKIKIALNGTLNVIGLEEINAEISSGNEADYLDREDGEFFKGDKIVITKDVRDDSGGSGDILKANPRKIYEVTNVRDNEVWLDNGWIVYAENIGLVG